MLYRVVLLLTFINGVFGGGASADRVMKFRREVNEDTEADADANGEAPLCGKDITPDFIQSCVYTDCFTNSADGVNPPHKGLTRRRMAGWQGPFKKQKGLCTVPPTGPNYDGAKLKDGSKAPLWPTTVAGCPVGDSRASEPILGPTSGDRVCSYLTGAPRVNATDGESCLCKTIRCRVITKEDKTVRAYTHDKESMFGDIKQGAKQTGCNFIVRIEASHAVPSVPKEIMWLIFGLALVVASITSAFFICLYGSKTHEASGGSDEGSNE